MRRIVSVKSELNLLTAAYQIYQGRFAPDEIEPMTVLEEYLRQPWWDMFVCQQDGEVVGGIHINFLSAEPRTAVVEHIYVRQELQCQGIGSALWNYVEENVFVEREIEWVMLEMEDPAKMTEEEVRAVEKIGVSLERRVKFWHMRGFSKADAPYLQGILPGAEDACYNLALLMKHLGPAKQQFVTSEDYLRMNREFCATYLEHAPEEDPFFLRIASALTTDGREIIRLLPANANRTFHDC